MVHSKIIFYLLHKTAGIGLMKVLKHEVQLQFKAQLI